MGAAVPSAYQARLGDAGYACYLVLATLVAPAMIEMGVLPMAAHLFVLYFGIISNVTPPVALAAYTASGIAQCNPSKCGFTAFKLALKGFILPFVFEYNHVLLGQGGFLSIVWAFLSACVGTDCPACTIQGYTFSGKPGRLFRIMIGGGALLCIWRGILTDVICAAICLAAHLTAKQTVDVLPGPGGRAADGT